MDFKETNRMCKSLVHLLAKMFSLQKKLRLSIVLQKVNGVQSFKRRFSVQDDIQGQSHAKEVRGGEMGHSRVQIGVSTKGRTNGHFRGIQFHMLCS